MLISGVDQSLLNSATLRHSRADDIWDLNGEKYKLKVIWLKHE